MIKINKELTCKVAAGASVSGRKRMNFNFHTVPEDPVNRMLNAVEPDAYFPPHKHTDLRKREVFIILQGRVVALEFSDDGEVLDHIVMDPAEGNFGVEFPIGSWHSIIPLAKGSVLYEMKDGPYDPNEDKTFAEWAPSENDPNAFEFIDKMLYRLGIEK